MKDRVKKGLELFVFFFKIGCFTFGGGWSILAQMEQEFVDKRKWLTKSELLDMVAVGRSVPGIMITNISMIFGYSVGGVFGGFCAVLGITTPAILILSIVTMFYSKLKDNVWCASALRGIRSAVVPIIASAAFSLGKEAFKTKISVAADDDMKLAENKIREKEAFNICLRKIKNHGLPMRLIDVEFTFDVNKIIFYFTADGRIDFRELVKDLAAVFRSE